MTAMREYRLGIIGGCMSHQAGMPFSQLYHQQAAQRLKERMDVKLRIRIARGFGLDPRERLAQLLADGPLDAALFHVRSLFVKAGLLVRKAEAGGRFALHPALFRRQTMDRWPFDVGDDAQPAAPGTRPVAPSRLRVAVGDINRWAGLLTGLDRWAMRDELAAIRRFRESCAACGVQPIVMGPASQPGAWVKDRVSRGMNRLMKAELPALNVPFFTIEAPDGRDAQLRLPDDPLHLNAGGHAFVGNLLCDVLSPLIASAR